MARREIKILDTWMRSKLPAGDFAPLVNVSKHTLYLWKQRFEAEALPGSWTNRAAPRRGAACRRSPSVRS